MVSLFAKLFQSIYFRFIPSERYSKPSYSQCGEDMILDHLFKWLKIDRPTYLDVGAHHPYEISNTYHFYKKGCTGVLVEPDPMLFKEIAGRREKDVCLNVGIGSSSQASAKFYVMTASTLNTFSEAEAKRYESYGNHRIVKVIDIPLLNINEILSTQFDSCPNLVSLDVEGLDLEIVQSLDFSKYRPQAFCIETITYTEDNTETKVRDVFDFLENKDYFVYADTYINTIFVDKQAWENR